MQIHRSLLMSIVGACVLTAGGCQSRGPVSQLTPDPQLSSFVEKLAHDLEAHAWSEILATADPAHYRVQVTEHGMPEPQYVAELFGLHRVENNIRTGPSVSWSDLERIESVQLHALTQDDDRYTLTGTVRLAGGEMLDLRAWIIQEQGRFRLTGGVG